MFLRQVFRELGRERRKQEKKRERREKTVVLVVFCRDLKPNDCITTSNFGSLSRLVEKDDDLRHKTGTNLPSSDRIELFPDRPEGTDARNLCLYTSVHMLSGI